VREKRKKKLKHESDQVSVVHHKYLWTVII
jgi:hypothetical protein